MPGTGITRSCFVFDTDASLPVVDAPQPAATALGQHERGVAVVEHDRAGRIDGASDTPLEVVAVVPDEGPAGTPQVDLVESDQRLHQVDPLERRLL